MHMASHWCFTKVSRALTWTSTKLKAELRTDQRQGDAALVYDERQAASLPFPISQLCNYKGCVFSSFYWDMPSKHHRTRLIAIEQYRWFTAGADASLTTNTHVPISDVQVGGRRKARTWKGCCSADGGLQKFGKKQKGSSVGERFTMTLPLVSLSKDNQWALGRIPDGKTDERPF